MNTINIRSFDMVNIFLPYPPSVNKLWGYGKGRVYKSVSYKAWLTEAHVAWLQQRCKFSVRRIEGPYLLRLEATPPDKRHRDIGNLEKSVSDFLQAAGIIQNDRLARRITVEWTDDTDAKVGVVATIYPLAIGSGQGTGAEV